MGFLLCVQLRSIIRNQTGIENWILSKARDRNHRRTKAFVYPYDLGFKENLRQVFNWKETFNVIGDGITWPVRPDCDPYTLTCEQLEQKKEKRQRTVRYEIAKSYPGSFCTVRYGLRTCICIPCSDEKRIPVEEGDYVLVTRWERYWLYGERVLAKDIVKHGDANSKIQRRKRPRGWFPRCCAYEAFRMEDLWSGKLAPDSDVVRSQFSNFGPEGYDEEEEEEQKEHVEENQSDETTSTSTTESSSSNSQSQKLRQRKSRQEQ